MKHFQLIIQIFIIVLVTIIFTPLSVASERLQIVATTGDIGAVIKDVVGEHGHVEILVRPGEDPHYVDPKPSFVRHLARADMVAFVGLDLEIGWLPTIITGSRNRKIQVGQLGHFDASQVISPLDQMSGAVDRSMGDVHPAGNPHYSTDPRQMARVALALGKRFSQLRPELSELFEKQARDTARDYIRQAQKWELKFAEIAAADRKIVTYHKAWSYVTNWLDIEDVIQIEPHPGVPSNPRHIARVADVIKKRGLRVILQESYYPVSAANILAERTGATLVIVNSQTPVGQSYVEHIDEMIGNLYEALRKK